MVPELDFTLNFPWLLLVFQKWFGDTDLFCSVPCSMQWITLPIGGKDGAKCRLCPAFLIFTGRVYCASISDWKNCCFTGAVLVQLSSFYYIIMAFQQLLNHLCQTAVYAWWFGLCCCAYHQYWEQWRAPKKTHYKYNNADSSMVTHGATYA